MEQLPYHLNLNGRLMPLDRPRIMGVLNCTPDSFYDGGHHATAAAAVAHGVRMLDAGADLVDMGGQTTKPGAEDIGAATEWERIAPVLDGLLSARPDAAVSVDTFHADVARRALAAGAAFINDVTGGRDPEMWSVVAEAGAPYCLMHLRGTPATMQDNPTYEDVVDAVYAHLDAGLHAAREAGISDVVLDPGFGFGKTTAHNYALLAALDRLHVLGAPILVGVSRKSMIWRPLCIEPAQALNGTTALHAWALERGAHLLRVHDVAAARETVALHALLRGDAPLTPHLSPA